MCACSGSIKFESLNAAVCLHCIILQVIKPTERKVRHATGLGLHCKYLSMDLKQNEIPGTSLTEIQIVSTKFPLSEEEQMDKKLFLKFV